MKKTLLSFLLIIPFFNPFTQAQNIPFQKEVKNYKKALQLDESYIAVQNKTLTWGLMNDKNRLTIPCTYDSLYNLPYVTFDPISYQLEYSSSDFVVATKADKVYVYTKKGKFLFEADAIMPRLMQHDIVLVKNNGKWGLFSCNGDVILDANCDSIDWKNDILCLKQGQNEYRFHPQKGNFVDNLGHKNVQ